MDTIRNCKSCDAGLARKSNKSFVRLHNPTHILSVPGGTISPKRHFYKEATNLSITEKAG